MLSLLTKGTQNKALQLVLVKMISHFILVMSDDITSWDPTGAGISANPGWDATKCIIAGWQSYAVDKYRG